MQMKKGVRPVNRPVSPTARLHKEESLCEVSIREQNYFATGNGEGKERGR